MLNLLFENHNVYCQKYMHSFVARSVVSSVSFEEGNSIRFF